MRAQVAAYASADQDRHIMSQRLPSRVSSDRKRWSAAGNDHARPRSLNRYGNKRDIQAMRRHDNRQSATAALQTHPAMGTSTRVGPAIASSARVQSP